MQLEQPADPWESPLAGVTTKSPGQSAKEMAMQQLREAPRAGLVGGLQKAYSAKAWAKGAIGEHRVGRSLARLPFGWTVLHDLTIPGTVANVDHLVIGPAGVFTINTKNHSGRKVWVGERAILVNGHKTDYLRNSRWEAGEARKALQGAVSDLRVTPVLAIFCKEMTVKQRPKDVRVLDAQLLRRWLVKQQRVLGQASLESVLRAAGGWARADAQG